MKLDEGYLLIISTCIHFPICLNISREFLHLQFTTIIQDSYILNLLNDVKVVHPSVSSYDAEKYQEDNIRRVSFILFTAGISVNIKTIIEAAGDVYTLKVTNITGQVFYVIGRGLLMQTLLTCVLGMDFIIQTVNYEYSPSFNIDNLVFPFVDNTLIPYAHYVDEQETNSLIKEGVIHNRSITFGVNEYESAQKKRK